MRCRLCELAGTAQGTPPSGAVASSNSESAEAGVFATNVLTSFATTGRNDEPDQQHPRQLRVTSGEAGAAAAAPAARPAAGLRTKGPRASSSAHRRTGQ